MKLACEKHAIKDIKKRIRSLHMLIRIMPYERAQIPQNEYHCYVKVCKEQPEFVIKRIEDMIIKVHKDKKDIQDNSGGNDAK